MRPLYPSLKLQMTEVGKIYVHYKGYGTNTTWWPEKPGCTFPYFHLLILSKFISHKNWNIFQSSAFSVNWRAGKPTENLKEGNYVKILHEQTLFQFWLSPCEQKATVLETDYELFFRQNSFDYVACYLPLTELWQRQKQISPETFWKWLYAL